MNENSIINFKIRCFIPKKMSYLITTKTFEYKGYTLKSAYVAHMINELIAKYFLTGETNFTIWSKILQELYGKFYARYVEFLVDNEIIVLMSNKQVGKTSRRYRLNLRIIKNEVVIRPTFYDKFLYRKLKSKRVDVSFTSLVESSICELVRKKLVDDLPHIALDFDKANNYLLSIKSSIRSESYAKNIISINHINSGDIYYKFDGYGRMHTNFTTLKKHIRKNFIHIDGELVEEVDIKNSQPFFLGLLIRKDYEGREMPAGLSDYVSLVTNHLFYEDFQSKANFISMGDRDVAKDYAYKVLFGRNNINTKENAQFSHIYPDVYDYIVRYKEKNNDYKALSHILQRMESDFLYNKVINELTLFYPHIKMFTVHDSIVYPAKYKKEVEGVFYKYLDAVKLFTNNYFSE